MELTIEQALQQGETAHKEGKLQDAERLYRAILKSQPAHPDANHNLGVLALSGNKADAALPLFKIALEANPKIEQFWLSYIDALIKEKQFENAKQVIKQGKTQGVAGEKLNVLETQLTPTTQVNEPKLAVQKKSLSLSEKRKKLAERKKQKKAKRQNLKAINPSQEQLSSLLQHYQNGRFGDAEKLAISITQEFPKHLFGWKVLEAVLKKTGRTPEAVFAGEKAAEINPEDAEARYNLGNTFKELGRLDEAKASYRQATVLKPDFAEAHYNLGNTLKELGRLEEAEASYTQALALKPGYADAHSNLGILLQELGRLDEAEASLRKAIAMKPDIAETHYNLGITRKELGRLEEAEASYEQTIELKPDYAEAHSNLGGTLQELGRLDEAEASYSQAIKLKPGYAEAHSNLGNALRELGRLEEAEANYRRAIALKPDYAEAHSNLGVTLKELGRLDEAEASYTQAIALKPDYADAHSNLGILLQELGRLDEAEASYKQAIAVKPGGTIGLLGYAEAKHMLAALSGETTATAPRDYVEGLFDHYAAKFESSLVDNLEYKIPRVIAEMIIKDSQLDLLGSIMDLGCGTGLLGAEIKQFCEYLEGIDLSGKMLNEAKKKNIYNKLIKEDILTYLSNASFNFDYFVSTDVFIYIGDLSDVFRLIKSRNKTGGKLAFSTENYDGDGFFLEQSGRYSHSKKYIEGLCEKYGYKISHFETQALRKEKEQYISGGLYLLDF
jgi:predicted TPR repeat methyltransferase